MVETEAAQRGVLQAILSLDSDGTFTALLEDFYKSVLPKYFALDLPKEPVFNEAPEPPTTGPYTRYSRARHQRHTDYEDALRQWGCRFRLTVDLTETAECFPWILEFGSALCEGRPLNVVPEPRTGTGMPPPGGWVRLAEPDTANENPSDWIRRNSPALKEHYRAVHKRQRSRAYSDSAKRKPDHYKWFVLHVCGGLKPGSIAEKLGLTDVQDDAVRKGVNSVSRALGVRRK
jgi:hypothetical protein